MTRIGSQASVLEKRLQARRNYRKKVKRAQALQLALKLKSKKRKPKNSRKPKKGWHAQSLKLGKNMPPAQRKAELRAEEELAFVARENLLRGTRYKKFK